MKEYHEELTLGTAGPSVIDSPRSSLIDGPGGTSVLSAVSSYPSIPGTSAIPISDGGAMVPIPPPPPPAKKSSAGLVIGILVLLAVLGGGGGAAFYFLQPDESAENAVKACKATLTAANAGNVVAAVGHFKTCEGSTKTAARNAIDTAAQKSAGHPGCAGLEDARAADRVGLPSALNLLKGKKCH